MSPSAAVCGPGELAATLASRPHVVFDLDGTLIDTLPDLAEGLNQALARHGLGRVTAEVVRVSLHQGLEGSVEAAIHALGLAPRWRRSLLDSYVEALERRGDGAARCFQGVETLLERLRGRGHRLAVCTNKPGAPARRLLARLGIQEHFELVVGADTCVHRKPHPEPLRHAIQQLGGDVSSALMIGDSVVDFACAQAAGVDCLIFEGGYGGVFTGGSRFCSFESLALALTNA